MKTLGVPAMHPPQGGQFDFSDRRPRILGVNEFRFVKTVDCPDRCGELIGFHGFVPAVVNACSTALLGSASVRIVERVATPTIFD